MFDQENSVSHCDGHHSLGSGLSRSTIEADFTEVSAMMQCETDEQTVLFLAGDTADPVFLDVFASAGIEIFHLTPQATNFPDQPEQNLSGKILKAGQAGWALIDLCIAVLILGVLVAFGLSALYYQSTGVELNELQQSARETADDGLSQLVVRVDSLPDDGTFTLQNNGSGGSSPVITINKACDPTLCDYVQVQGRPADTGNNNTPKQSTKKPNSPAGGYYPSFAGATFLRRWSVRTVDAELGLKEITIVILKDENDTSPLAVFQHKTPITLNQ